MRSPAHLPRVLLKLRFVPLVGTLVLASCGRQRSQTIKPKAVSPHSVTITWKASKSPVAGYNVYRILSPAGALKVSPGIVTETQFTDRTVEAGYTYAYFVTAVDSKGIESRPSEKVSITVPTPTAPTATR